MDYLQQANRDLEKQLKDTIDQHVEVTRRANDLEGKNAELLLELKDINRLSKQIEEDKHRDVSIVQSELVETKVLSTVIFHFLYFIFSSQSFLLGSDEISSANIKEC